MSRIAGFARLFCSPNTDKLGHHIHISRVYVCAYVLLHTDRTHTRHSTTRAHLELSETLKNKPDENVRHQANARARENRTHQNRERLRSRTFNTHTHTHDHTYAQTSQLRAGDADPRGLADCVDIEISVENLVAIVSHSTQRAHFCVSFSRSRTRFPCLPGLCESVPCVCVCFVSSCVCVCVCVPWAWPCACVGRAARNVVYKYQSIYILCLKLCSQQFMTCVNC